MAITKKDFIAATEIVKRVATARTFSSDTERKFAANAVREAFIELFQSSNPRFNIVTFNKACEVSGG